MKLVGSWKLESGVDKGIVREKKKGDLKNKGKKKKTIVKIHSLNTKLKFIVYIFTLALSGKAKSEN